MRFGLAARALLLAASVLVAAPASAQEYDQAVDAFTAGNYEDAASLFYVILSFEEDASIIAEAQYGLAKSLQKLDLQLAAFARYQEIVREGSDHPYFVSAIEGVLDVADALKDELTTPPVIDGMYKTNYNALKRINPEILQRIHYVIGKHSFDRGDIRDAKEFLRTVKEGHPKYPFAQYILGLIRLGVGMLHASDIRYDKALEHFENVRATVNIETDDEDLRRLRDLATMGVARTRYEEGAKLEDGDPLRTRALRDAIREYRHIPRFSESWPDALFERAWAHVVKNEFGKALGALHSLEQPYFSEYFYAESYILKAITYYYNCQWDKVHEVLDTTNAVLTPMTDQIETLLQADRPFEDWYLLLADSLKAGPNHGNPELIPWRVAKSIARDPKLHKMERYLGQLEKEASIFDTSETFARSEMGVNLTEDTLAVRDAFLAVIGKFVKVRLADNNGQLRAFNTQAKLVRLETQQAETEWLELGRSIGGAPRGVLPVPFVPEDTFEFWWFRDEVWVDELGYYEYSIKSECYE